MRGISDAYYAAQMAKPDRLIVALNESENAFYILEPFLSISGRYDIWNQFQQFTGLCESILLNDSLKGYHSKAFDSYQSYKNKFRTDLYSSLFTN